MKIIPDSQRPERLLRLGGLLVEEIGMVAFAQRGAVSWRAAGPHPVLRPGTSSAFIRSRTAKRAREGRRLSSRTVVLAGAQSVLTAGCAQPALTPSGSASSSCTRELISSLVKTLRRWYWTVRADRNSWAAISGLDRPARASRAIWSS
jgi:hypothetical protein